MFALDLKLPLLVFLFAAAVAHAQAPTAPGAFQTAAPIAAPVLQISPMSAATAAEIQKISENMTVLSAQLSELDLKAKIAAKQRELQGFDRATPFSPLGSSSGLPSVISVAGLKGHLEALLVFPGGVVQRVKAGDVIGDRKVTTVAVNEVILTDLKGKNSQRLAFGTTAVTRDGGTATPSGMPTPTSFPVGPMTPGALAR